MRHRLAFAVASLLAVSLLPGCSGQRLLHVEIERNGVRALETQYGVSDSLDPAAMWASLQGETFTAVAPIPSEPTDPEKASLKGKIRIVIHHVDKEIAAAKVSEVRLTRADGTNDHWKLAVGEASRTSHAAGL